MDNQKKLDLLITKATSQSNQQITLPQLKQILELVNSRADMPKHVINSLSKRIVLKNKRVLINIFVILEYLGYQCQLSMYSQISNKEFLFKISGILMNKDIQQEVKNKILQTIYCWEELFRPHEDLLPLFFQFYAGLLRNGFDIPHDYRSPFRPASLKQYKKPQQQTSTSYKNSQKPSRSDKNIIPPSLTQKKTFQQIRQKLILTNQIIDNVNPAQSVKDNGLLLQMMEQIKQCQKRVNKTINENPSQNIMQLALAANDDIFITYRRFKDLQRNKKPQPFILTQLASDLQKENQIKKTQSQIQKNIQKQNSIKNQTKIQSKKIDDFLDFNQTVKKQSPFKVAKKQENILDFDYQPQQPAKKQEKPKSDNIFDLLDDAPPTHSQFQPKNAGFDLFQPSAVQTKSNPIINIGNIDINNFDSLLLTTQSVPQPSGNGFTLNNPVNYNLNLNATDFTTQADIKNYDKKSAMDRIDDLTYEYLKK